MQLFYSYYSRFVKGILTETHTVACFERSKNQSCIARYTVWSWSVRFPRVHPEAGLRALRAMELVGHISKLGVRHLLLLAWHLFLLANLVTTSKAPVTTSVALVSTSEPCYY